MGGGVYICRKRCSLLPTYGFIFVVVSGSKKMKNAFHWSWFSHTDNGMVPQRARPHFFEKEIEYFNIYRKRDQGLVPYSLSISTICDLYVLLCRQMPPPHEYVTFKRTLTRKLMVITIWRFKYYRLSENARRELRSRPCKIPILTPMRWWGGGGRKKSAYK